MFAAAIIRPVVTKAWLPPPKPKRAPDTRLACPPPRADELQARLAASDLLPLSPTSHGFECEVGFGRVNFKREARISPLSSEALQGLP